MIFSVYLISAAGFVAAATSGEQGAAFSSLVRQATDVLSGIRDAQATRSDESVSATFQRFLLAFESLLLYVDQNGLLKTGDSSPPFDVDTEVDDSTSGNLQKIRETFSDLVRVCSDCYKLSEADAVSKSANMTDLFIDYLANFINDKAYRLAEAERESLDELCETWLLPEAKTLNAESCFDSAVDHEDVCKTCKNSFGMVSQCVVCVLPHLTDWVCVSIKGIDSVSSTLRGVLTNVNTSQCGRLPLINETTPSATTIGPGKPDTDGLCYITSTSQSMEVSDSPRDWNTVLRGLTMKPLLPKYALQQAFQLFNKTVEVAVLGYNNNVNISSCYGYQDAIRTKPSDDLSTGDDTRLLPGQNGGFYLITGRSTTNGFGNLHPCVRDDVKGMQTCVSMSGCDFSKEMLYQMFRQAWKHVSKQAVNACATLLESFEKCWVRKYTTNCARPTPSFTNIVCADSDKYLSWRTLRCNDAHANHFHVACILKDLQLVTGQHVTCYAIVGYWTDS